MVAKINFFCIKIKYFLLVALKNKRSIDYIMDFETIEHLMRIRDNKNYVNSFYTRCAARDRKIILQYAPILLPEFVAASIVNHARDMSADKDFSEGFSFADFPETSPETDEKTYVFDEVDEPCLSLDIAKSGTPIEEYDISVRSATSFSDDYVDTKIEVEYDTSQED